MIRRSLARVVLSIYVPIALLVLWWLATRGDLSPYWPSPGRLIAAFKDVWLFAGTRTDLAPSMLRLGLGLGLAIGIGVVAGLVLGLNDVLRRAVAPILHFCRSIPAPALLPVLIVIMGIGTSQKVVFIFIATLWPILLNTIDGVRSVSPGLNDLGRSYRISRLRFIRDIVVPAASPQIFAGIRVSLAIGVAAVIISEMVAASEGLGYFTLLSQQTFALTNMWTGIVMIGLVGIALNALFTLLERRVLAWHKGWKGTRS